MSPPLNRQKVGRPEASNYIFDVVTKNFKKSIFDVREKGRRGERQVTGACQNMELNDIQEIFFRSATKSILLWY